MRRFFTGLNAGLKDYPYPLPSPEEVFNKLNGGKVFSKIDVSEAFLQIPVEKNSCKLLCINTHIVISSKTKELHREHLNKVFAQIREFGFKVKEAKCDFCMNKIKYLGLIIAKDGKRPDPERASAIKDMPAPDNVTLSGAGKSKEAL